MHDALLDGPSKIPYNPLTGFYKASLGQLADGAATADVWPSAGPIVALGHTVTIPP